LTTSKHNKDEIHTFNYVTLNILDNYLLYSENTNVLIAVKFTFV